MRCGYSTFLRGEPGAAAQLREEVLMAEQAGLDGVFFPEHHGPATGGGAVPMPLSLAGFVLGMTSEMRAGPMPMLLPLHDPLRVAEEAALLHFASDERLLLGIGAGYHEEDFAQVGIDPKSAFRRLRDGLAVIDSAWAAEPWPVDGEHHRFLARQPLVQRPEQPPPILLATGGPVGFRRAARGGHGIILDSRRTFAELEEVIARYRATCAEEGVEPGTVAVGRRVWFGDAAEVDEYIETHNAGLRFYLAGVDANPSAWLDSARDEEITRESALSRVFAGEPEDVAEQMLAWAEKAGVDYFIIRLNTTEKQIDPARIAEQLRRAAAFSARLAA
jgi:alkanesulfonate monooxygenase SsuD/methylene tetrahydromethanopterin reductase-like flavin-dependent oxidoreductase (luciferase family)